MSKCLGFLKTEEMEEVRCKYCNKLLLKREKGEKQINLEIKCQRCGKINFV